MLELIQIRKEYVVGDSKIEALKGVDLAFRKKDFVSILGPSGCGKTTLLNIIGGLDRYSSGDLKIDGVSTKEFKSRDWDSYRNHKIGFVFQSYNLIPHVSVIGNVELALTLSGISKGERRKRCEKALEDVGLLDQKNKKPKQLSGGQLQRVAIARALVNNPEIILADEPTGALDSETSIQVMELLAKVAEDRLVVMVTHNRELADKYSTRIIELLDGQKVKDTSPVTEEELSQMALEREESLKAQQEQVVEDENTKTGKKQKKEKKKKTKTSMSFFTALNLSGRNLISKKARTILTAFAGSIGIIGVSLILALSTGLNGYINAIQRDTMASYPLTVNEMSMDLSAINGLMEGNKDAKKFTDEQKVYITKTLDKFQKIFKKNVITQEYLDNAIDTIDKDLYYDIQYKYKTPINLFTTDESKQPSAPDYYRDVNTSAYSAFYANYMATVSEMPKSETLLNEQYEIVNKNGRLPKEANELALVVDEKNQIFDFIADQLGININTESTTIDFSALENKEFKLLLNDNVYVLDGNKFTSKIQPYTEVSAFGPAVKNVVSKDVFDSGLTLKIVGILRLKENVTAGCISTAFAYTPALTNYVLTENAKSAVINYQIQNPTIDAFTGVAFANNNTYEKNIGLFGESVADAIKNDDGDATTPLNFLPSDISIYAKDFDTKEKIKDHLDDYNDSIPEEQRVNYNDIMSLFITAIKSLIDGITYGLIAFTGISLVVSSIMIGIITYISVLERTKEIGIIRSIGGRKIDIMNIFNSETLIIGLMSGLIGVLLTVCFALPIGSLLGKLTGIKGLMHFKLTHAIFMVLLSMSLTLISGLIPSTMASKKDPVKALKAE